MTVRLKIEGLSKRFAAPVLNQVGLQIARGGVHGLVGENGAGKSTLINIVSGLLAADAGDISLNGKASPRSSRRKALDHGVALASQELSLIETLSVAENILLSDLPGQSLGIARVQSRARARELMDLVGLVEVSTDDRLSTLTLAQKQLVELAKALSMPEANCQLLILDEPTSALTGPQADRLHEIIRDRADAGLSVLYVSHRLEDVLQVCDEVSVLRDGAIALCAPSSALTSNDLIKAMSGEALMVHKDDNSKTPGEPCLRVAQLATDIFPEPISLCCHRGEILGIAGLAGSGRSELLHSIFGLSAESKGSVLLMDAIDNHEIVIDSPSQAVKNGIALIAEDRKSQGIFADKSVSMNSTVAELGKLRGALSTILPRRERQVTEELIDRLKVKCEGPLQSIDRLSGGNQQKVLIARWLQARANVWLLDEPTRGVDVTSKLAIHEQLRKLRDDGAALLMVSSELEELMALCDRILVLSNGKQVAEFQRGQWSKEMLLEAAFSEYTHRAVRAAC